MGNYFFNEEGRDRMLGFFCAGVRLRIDDEDVGVGAICDPHFRAVQDVIVTVPFRSQHHADDVGSSICFAHRQCANQFAVDQAGQVLRLLLLVAVYDQLVDAQVRVCAIAQGYGSGSARQLLHGDAMIEVGAFAAAILTCVGETTTESPNFLNFFQTSAHITLIRCFSY